MEGQEYITKEEYDREILNLSSAVGDLRYGIKYLTWAVVILGLATIVLGLRVFELSIR